MTGLMYDDVEIVVAEQPHRAYGLVAGVWRWDGQTPVYFAQSGEHVRVLDADVDLDAPHVQRSLSHEDFEQIMEVVSNIKLPPLVAETGGVLGAGMFALKVVARDTEMRLRWSHQLPREWTSLAEIVESLLRRGSRELGWDSPDRPEG